MKKVLLLAVVSLWSCGEPETAQSVAGVATTCPAGQRPYDFAAVDPLSGEAVSQGRDGSVEFPAINQLLILPNTTCTGQGSTLNWQTVLQDSCQGKTSCDFESADCFAGGGQIHVEYACSAAPDTRLAVNCAAGSSNRCLVSLSCPQAYNFATLQPLPKATDVACVPEHCHATERRDGRLQCVAADKPREWSNFSKGGTGLRRSINLTSNYLKLKMDSVSRVYDPAIGGTRLAIDKSQIPALKNGPFPVGLNEFQLVGYNTLLANAKYQLDSNYFYPVPDGQPNNGNKGVVTIWVEDRYGPKNGPFDRAFRCVVHTIDMKKYPAGTQTTTPGLYSIPISEEFVVPRACATSSGSQLQAAAALARKSGLSTLDYLNSRPFQGAVLHASYDVAGETEYQEGDGTFTEFCAPDPLGFFFNADAGAPDSYDYYMQDSATMLATFGSSYNPSSGVTVLEANRTFLGVAQVLPKKLAYKVIMPGPARGELRAEARWYLHADKHRFWATQGLKMDRYEVKLKTYLVPLTADGGVTNASLHYLLGETKVTTGSGYETTLMLKNPVTPELRTALTTEGGALNIPTVTGSVAARNFKFRVCPEFSDGAPFHNPAIYSLEFGPGDKGCQYSAPFEIRLDRSVEFMAPVSVNDFEDSQTNAAGDSQGGESSDADSKNGCELNIATSAFVCRTVGAASLDGSGLFSGLRLFNYRGGLTMTLNAGAPTVRGQLLLEVLGLSVVDIDKSLPIALFGDSTWNLDILTDVATGKLWEGQAKKLNERSMGGHVTYRAGAVATDRSEEMSRTAAFDIQGIYATREYFVRVSYGLLQGVITYGPTAGVGADVSLKYKFTSKPVEVCSADGGVCDKLFKVQESMPLPDAARACYYSGGQLAELRTADQVRYVRQRLTELGQPVWLGAQTANQYASAPCQQTWNDGVCRQNHLQQLRWLSNDQDFATNANLGRFTAIDGGVNTAANVTMPTGSGVLPFGLLNQLIGSTCTPALFGPQYCVGGGNSLGSFGVVMATDGRLTLAAANESHPSVCQLPATVDSYSHEATVTLEEGASAGVMASFCTPSRFFGVCLEGVVRFIEFVVKPTIGGRGTAYFTGNNRVASNSAVIFRNSLDIYMLSGNFDLVIKLLSFYEPRIRLFEWSGIHVFGDAQEAIIPVLRDYP